MQGLTDAPYRNAFTAAQIIGLLTGPLLSVQPGLSLMNSSNEILSDISDQLVSGSLTRTNNAVTQGACSLNISQELGWGLQRVQPYMILSNGQISAEWVLGVYLMATPAVPIGTTPLVYSVTGYDLMYILDNPIGDNYTVAAGTSYLSAIMAAIAAGGGGTNVMLDQTAADETLPTAQVWPLQGTGSYANDPDQGGTYNYTDVINDLLGSIGYVALWCDWNGVYRAQPYVDPSDAEPEFAFYVSTTPAGSPTPVGNGVVIEQNRTSTTDTFNAPNWWRFIASNWPTTPVEGNGQYTVQNVDTGSASQTAVERVIKSLNFVSAASQAALVSLGNLQVQTDMQNVQTVNVGIASFPHSWNWDVATMIDPAGPGTVQVQVQSWMLNLAPVDGSQIWQIT